ncbi:MAG: RHS repeat-associated core domain-containing protein [Anaerolineae bacterium]
MREYAGAYYSSGETFEYAYDAMSNVTAMTETITSTVVTTYTYNAANQLATARASDDDVTWHYTHDQRGNLVRQTPGGTAPAEGETRYTYDAANQLVRVELYTSGDYTTLAEATYDGDGERVWLTTWAEGVPLTVTYGVFQGQLLVTDDGTQATLHLHPSAPLRAGGRSLIAEYGDGWAYHLRDGTGSLRQVADESGAVTLARAYEPFGGILQEQGLYETAFGFLGAQLDRISGLLYAGGRYYDPATGRFLTPDRAFDPYNPRTLNPYAPFQNPTLWLLAPLAIIVALKGKKRRKYRYWLLLLLIVGVGASVILTSCGPQPTPTPTPPPLPPAPLPPTPEPIVLPQGMTAPPGGQPAHITDRTLQEAWLWLWNAPSGRYWAELIRDTPISVKWSDAGINYARTGYDITSSPGCPDFIFVRAYSYNEIFLVRSSPDVPYPAAHLAGKMAHEAYHASLPFGPNQWPGSIYEERRAYVLQDSVYEDLFRWTDPVRHLTAVPDIRTYTDERSSLVRLRRRLNLDPGKTPLYPWETPKGYVFPTPTP